MQNGKYSIGAIAGADLSASRNLVLTTSGGLQGDPTATDTLGALEGNAATANLGEKIFVTLAGTATCIAGDNLTPFAHVMVDAANAGRVIDHVATAGFVAIGKFVPELRDGALVGGIIGEEVTVHLYSNKTNAF